MVVVVEWGKIFNSEPIHEVLRAVEVALRAVKQRHGELDDSDIIYLTQLAREILDVIDAVHQY